MEISADRNCVDLALVFVYNNIRKRKGRFYDKNRNRKSKQKESLNRKEFRNGKDRL